MALVGNDPTNSNSHGKMANFLTSDFLPSIVPHQVTRNSKTRQNSTGQCFKGT